MLLAKLVLSEPFKPTRHVLLDKSPFYIGRDPDCDFVLERTSISKKHLCITYDGEKYSIEDLESKNGFLVNGKKVSKATLANDDLVSLGGLDLRFQKIKSEQRNAELEKDLVKFKTAMQFAQTIGSNRILDLILNETMDALMRLSQAERGFLMIENENGDLEMVRSRNITSEEVSPGKSPLSSTAIEKCVQSKQSIAISNALDDTYFGEQTSVQEMELKTLVCVPILIEHDHVSGVLYADSSRKEQEFTQLDVEVLESLAANAGMAIDNAKLNQDVSRLVFEASDALKELEEKADAIENVHPSVRNVLHSLTYFRRKRARGKEDKMVRSPDKG